VQAFHVAAFVKDLQGQFTPPTVKQHLAAIRMLFDWLVTGHVIDTNPAHAVRGPKYVVKKGKTPVLDAGEARALLDAIPDDTLVGLRDRALIGVMVYTFARINAVLVHRFQEGDPRMGIPPVAGRPVCGQGVIVVSGHHDSTSSGGGIFDWGG
jgi:site-specific recombinase XerC